MDAELKPGDLVIALYDSTDTIPNSPKKFYRKHQVFEFEGMTPMYDPANPRCLVWDAARGKSVEVWANNFALYRRRRNP